MTGFVLLPVLPASLLKKSLTKYKRIEFVRSGKNLKKYIYHEGQIDCFEFLRDLRAFVVIPILNQVELNKQINAGLFSFVEIIGNATEFYSINQFFCLNTHNIHGHGAGN